MSDLKKTTITLPKRLHQLARIRAAETDTQLKDVVIAALELFCSQRLDPRKSAHAAVIRLKRGKVVSVVEEAN